MARVIQPSLNGGEISDHLQARVDLALYTKSLKTASNFIVRRTGGMTTRPGTRFRTVSGTANGEKNRLARFVYSRDQAYLLEFYPGRVSVMFRGSRLLTGLTLAPVSITASTTAFTLTFAALHNLADGEVVRISGATGTGTIDQLNGDHRITVLSGLSFSVPKISAGAATYTSGATVAQCVTLATPYSESDNADLRFAQSADVMTIFSRSHLPHELRRYSESHWAIEEAGNERGPFKRLNTDAGIRVYASAATGTTTVYATAKIFEANHVGGLFYIEERNLATIDPWEAGKMMAFNYVNGKRCRNDGKVYIATSTAYEQYWHCGTVPPTHESGKAKDGNGAYSDPSESTRKYGIEWEYEHSGYGVVRIDSVDASGMNMTGTVLRTLPSSVVGGASSGAGPWSMTGDGVTTTLAVAGATSEVEEQFVVTIDDDPIAPSQYTVSGAVLTFTTAPAAAAAVVAYQQSVDNLTDFWAHGAWGPVEGYPGCGTYEGDRLILASTTGDPQRIDGSRVGDYYNFLASVPLQDDDPLQTSVGGREMSSITDIIPLDRLVALTAAGTYRIGGIESDILTPGTAAPKLLNAVGAADIPAIMIRRAAVFVERGRRRISEFAFGDLNTPQTSDLTVMADHLWRREKRVVGMDYADDPYGLLYVVRSDGALPTLAYLKEQEVMGWSVLTTNGSFEQVCVVPEQDEDAVYVTVSRSDAYGVTRRYIESFTLREPADFRDTVCVDSSLSYNGIVTGDPVVITQAASGWEAGASLYVSGTTTVTFTSADIGSEVWVYYDGQNALRVTITGIVSASAIEGVAGIDVPESLRGLSASSWAIARDTFSGLTHLVGREIAVQADGLPYGSVVVSESGTITLDHCAAVVHAGLPFEAYIETLDLNIPGRETVRPLGKTVSRVSVMLSESIGLWAGQSRETLEEYAGRDVSDSYDVIEPFTGLAEVELNSSWDDRGSVQLWQLASAPLTILSVIPDVVIGRDH